jgi:hypothetical protein
VTEFQYAGSSAKIEEVLECTITEESSEGDWYIKAGSKEKKKGD